VAAFSSPEHWNEKNPFLSSWNATTFSAAAASLRDFRGSLSRLALASPGWGAQGHARYDGSPTPQECTPMSRLGASGDGGKQLCGVENLAPGCVIYSLGSNNHFDFEEAALAATPCEIFTFDCTSNPPVQDYGPRLHFERICLGDGGAGDPRFRTLADIAAERGHSRIDLLKTDIEGFEFAVVETLWRGALLGGGSGDAADAEAMRARLRLLPEQVTFEVHALTDSPHLVWGSPVGKPEQYLSVGDMLTLWVQLTDIGYTVISRENNAVCPHCCEFTLVRAFR
jgi:hypothetical protein